MASIFISYRRADSADMAGRLFDRLTARYGKDMVFMDVGSIPAGVDFRQAVERAMRETAIQLVVIGPQWSEQRDERGVARLSAPNDTVRIEIETALQRGITVIPLLVEGTPMPRADQLPQSIRALASRNALPIRSGLDFDTDVARIIAAIEQWMHAPVWPYRQAADAPHSTGNGATFGAPVPLTTRVDRSRRPVALGAAGTGAVLLVLVVVVAVVILSQGATQRQQTDGQPRGSPTATATATPRSPVPGPMHDQFQDPVTARTSDGSTPSNDFKVGDTVYAVGTVPAVPDGQTHTLSIRWYLNGSVLPLTGGTSISVHPSTHAQRMYFSLSLPQAGAGMAKVYWDSLNDSDLAQTLYFSIHS